MSIHVICNDPAFKAEIEKKIASKGFPVQSAKAPPRSIRGLVEVRTTSAAYAKLAELDKTLIGTPDYMGIAYFWNHDYRHWMRDASAFNRCRVHDRFLQAGLPMDGSSDRHEGIVRLCCET